MDPDAAGPQPHTGSSLETIRHMVAGGLGLTVLPRSSVENRPLEESPLLVARSFSGKTPSRRIALVWRKTFPRLKAIEALHQAIMESPMRGVQLLPDAGIAET